MLESPNTLWTKRTRAPTTTLLSHNAKECGQLISHKHNKGNIYWLKTALSFAIGLKSKLSPMLPPKQKKKNLRKDPNIPHNTSREMAYPYFLKDENEGLNRKWTTLCNHPKHVIISLLNHHLVLNPWQEAFHCLNLPIIERSREAWVPSIPYRRVYSQICHPSLFWAS